MHIKLWAVVVLSGAAVLTSAQRSARADQQEIAPGRGLQSSIVVDTGANGLCETVAIAGDIQAAAIGQGTPNRNEVRCGTNKVAESTAAGDDVQRIAVGASCNSAN